MSPHQDDSVPMASIEEVRLDKKLWRELVREFPDLDVGKMPCIDEIVVEFLKLHDVYARPVESATSASPGTNALLGAVGGPIAVGMNQALTSQVKGAALQEWTSWKQWALSHADWSAFKEGYQSRHQERYDQIPTLFASSLVQESIARIRENEKAKARDSTLSLVLAALILFVLGLVPAWMEYLGKPELIPSQPQQKQSTVDSAGYGVYRQLSANIFSVL